MAKTQSSETEIILLEAIDFSTLSGLETKVLNQTVGHNIERSTGGFYFN